MFFHFMMIDIHVLVSNIKCCPWDCTCFNNYTLCTVRYRLLSQTVYFDFVPSCSNNSFQLKSFQHNVVSTKHACYSYLSSKLWGPDRTITEIGPDQDHENFKFSDWIRRSVDLWAEQSMPLMNNMDLISLSRRGNSFWVAYYERW